MKKRRKLKILMIFVLFILWIGGAVYGHQLATSSNKGLTTVTIGYQAGDPVSLSKARGVLASKMKALGYKVVFREFTDGASEMQALASGSIDYARTGDTPL